MSGKAIIVLPLFYFGKGKDCNMQKENHITADTTQRIRKTIGKVSYDVSLYFSKTSTETVHDKLKRIIADDYIHKKIS